MMPLVQVFFRRFFTRAEQLQASLPPVPSDNPAREDEYRRQMEAAVAARERAERIIKTLGEPMRPA